MNERVTQYNPCFKIKPSKNRAKTWKNLIRFVKNRNACVLRVGKSVFENDA